MALNKPKPSLRPLLANVTSEAPFDASACSEPPSAGPCNRRLQRFFHQGGQCLLFSYGGCAGNRNNFFTEAECARRCLRRPLIEEVDLRKLHSDSSCSLPPDPGSCSDRLQRFYFNGASGRCEPFLFSGCGGNANNFAKLDKCQGRCHKDD